MSVENNMKSPKDFRIVFGVLNIGMVIITVAYVIIGLFGYIKYGDKLFGSITLNLPADNL